MSLINKPVSAGRRLLLIAPPASYRTFSYLEAARRLGVPVLVASEGKHSLVSQWVGGVHVDLGQPGALDVLLETAGEEPFAGVVATDDSTVELASRVGEVLGLSHNPPAAARLSRRKDLARAALLAAGLPVPRHRVLDPCIDLDTQLKELEFPVVVKPLALSASRGVIRADDVAAVAGACDRIASIMAREPASDPRERTHVLVETFVSGPEFALEGILHRGRLAVLAIFDKPDPMNGPYFEETYYITPTRMSADLRGRIEQVVADACNVYGLREGPVHAEVRLADGVPWIMEVAARTIGGQCSRLLSFGTGRRLEELVIAHAIGESPVVQRQAGAAGVLMIPIPRAGVLRRVEGVLAARRVPHIKEVEISLREGYELVPLPEGDRYLGFVFSEAPTAAEAEQALRTAHEKLNIVVAPVWRLEAGS